jgi:hypothetical protein
MPFTPTKYKRGPQHAHETDSSPPGTAADTLLLQQIVGVFLYLARTLLWMAWPLSPSISSPAHRTPTTAVMSHSDLLLQYFASHPNPSVTYKASDMHLLSIRMHHLPVNQVHAQNRLQSTCWATRRPGTRPEPRHPILSHQRYPAYSSRWL